MVGMGWDVGVGVGLGVPENKLNVVVGRIEINLKCVGFRVWVMRKVIMFE